MTSILQRWFPFTKPAEPIQPGMYASQPQPEAPIPYRLHLRLEPDGSGVLLVNAATILHLNASAAAHALELIRGVPAEAAAAAVRRRFRVSRRRALADQQDLREHILRLATQPDLDPVVYLGMERQEPRATRPSAPYRLDLALTYATDPDGVLDPLARRRVDRELTTDEWKGVLKSAWAAGIPHVTFTGGEPTRRPDLVDLVAYAQALGQISGLLTQGHRLAQSAYLASLAAAGLDHILYSLAPDEAVSMAGLRAALASDIFTAVHLISAEHTTRNRGLFERLKAMGVPAVSLTVTDPGDAGRDLLPEARKLLARPRHGLGVGPPGALLPPASAQAGGRDAGEGGGRAWLYVEPDGDVLVDARAGQRAGQRAARPLGRPVGSRRPGRPCIVGRPRGTCLPTAAPRQPSAQSRPAS